MKVSTYIAGIVAVAIAGLGGFKLAEWQGEQRLSAESWSVSDAEYRIVKLAEAYCGEAKGQPDEWVWTDGQSAPLLPSAIYNRMEDKRWPVALTRVLLQPNSKGTALQINALGDAVPENLLSEECAGTREAAARAVKAMVDGTFVPSTTAHSWATPKAAQDHAYFKSMEKVAEGSGHQYFADASGLSTVRPKPRPACIATNSCGGSELAPLESLRPKQRPIQSTINDAVDEALVQAMLH